MEHYRELEIWRKVNLASDLGELADLIKEVADENGEIQGRRRKFNAEKMANFCRQLAEPDNEIPYTTLTRNYGIRQQAIYIINLNKVW